MYILDEIDAALDLSHTQNIGVMLKTHFKNSQFIIVSLKEVCLHDVHLLEYRGANTERPAFEFAPGHTRSC